MKTKAFSLLAILAGMASAAACGPYGTSEEDLMSLAREAGDADQKVADAAIAKLRTAGQRGVDSLLGFYSIATTFGKRAEGFDDRYHRAIDRVARQKDAAASGLYWYTDFDRAKSAAAAAGKPILSLRLLGQLDDELSCANSRFFRDVLYPDESISAFLRDNYILHWKSVRPVPVMTIDFGDGRVIERTITGNSIHYLLDPKGRLIDGLPGLYSPSAFMNWVDQGNEFVRAHASKEGSEWRRAIRVYHREHLETIAIAFDAELKAIGLQHFKPASASRWAPQPIQMDWVSEQGWNKLAARRLPEVTISAGARRLIAAKLDPRLRDLGPAVKLEGQEQAPGRAALPVPAPLVAQLARTKGKLEAPVFKRFPQVMAPPKGLEANIRNLRSTIAEDTVRNEFIFHRRIHARLGSRIGLDVDEVNSWIYAELFETPESDPWLGLNTPEFYTGLTRGGLRTY